MDMDGRQGNFAYSLFPTYQQQASVNGSMASPVVSLQEQHTASNTPRSHNAHDDPYGLLTCAPSNTKSRKPGGNVDCDGERGLECLVSNILEEVDSQDSYTDGSLPACDPFWSPLIDEMSEYFLSGAKPWQDPTFPQNYGSQGTFGKVQAQTKDCETKDFYQHFSGIATKQELLSNLPIGDSDSYTHSLRKLQSGLKMQNAYPSQKQQGKYHCTSAYKDGENSQSINHFPDLSEVFRLRSEINSPCFHPYIEDHLNHNSNKPIGREQYVSQDINQLVNSFQSPMSSEYNSSSHGDYPAMHRQTMAMHCENSTDEQFKITDPVMSSQSTARMLSQKQQKIQLGADWRESNQGLTIKHYDSLQEIHDFSPQSTDVQQKKQFYAPFSRPIPYQSEIIANRQKTFYPNISMNQLSKQHIQQSNIQSKIKPVMQKGKEMVHTAQIQGGGFATRFQSKNNMAVDKRQGLSQSLSFDELGSMQFKTSEGEHNRIMVGNTQQLQRSMCQVNDPRRPSNSRITSSHISSGSILNYGTVLPGMEVADALSATNCSAFNSYGIDMMAGRGQSTYYGLPSTLTTPVTMKQEGPVLQLHFYLDECHEQWQCLEKEREKIQAKLSRTFHLSKSAALINSSLPEAPANPTRVGRLIGKHGIEQARVTVLLGRVECLNNTPLHMDIHTALNRHNMAIWITQLRCKENMVNMSKHQGQRGHFTEDIDTLLLAMALKDLAAATKKLCTALWCVEEMIFPKPVWRQEQPAATEATHSARCPSMFDRYSFMK